MTLHREWERCSSPKQIHSRSSVSIRGERFAATRGFGAHIELKMLGPRELGRALRCSWNDVQQNHTFALAAGLAYYFLLSLFPLLIVLASAVAYLPVPNLWDR